MRGPWWYPLTSPFRQSTVPRPLQSWSRGPPLSVLPRRGQPSRRGVMRSSPLGLSHTRSGAPIYSPSRDYRSLWCRDRWHGGLEQLSTRQKATVSLGWFAMVVGTLLGVGTLYYSVVSLSAGSPELAAILLFIGGVFATTLMVSGLRLRRGSG